MHDWTEVSWVWSVVQNFVFHKSYYHKVNSFKDQSSNKREISYYHKVNSFKDQSSNKREMGRQKLFKKGKIEKNQKTTEPLKTEIDTWNCSLGITNT